MGGKGGRHKPGLLGRELGLGPERNYYKYCKLEKNLPGRAQGLGRAGVEELGEELGQGEEEG